MDFIFTWSLSCCTSISHNTPRHAWALPSQRGCTVLCLAQQEAVIIQALEKNGFQSTIQHTVSSVPHGEYLSVNSIKNALKRHQHKRWLHVGETKQIHEDQNGFLLTWASVGGGLNLMWTVKELQSFGCRENQKNPYIFLFFLVTFSLSFTWSHTH